MSSQYDPRARLGREIFGAADLGDRRRTTRLVKSFDLMCRHPGGTLPDKLASPQDLRGLYRLCESDGVTHEAVIGPARALPHSR
jgi:Transposase DNA-binding